MLAARAAGNWPEFVGTGMVAGILTWVYVAAAGVPEAGTPGDVDFFRASGEAILRGDLAATYANPDMQGGPAQLVVDTVLLAWHGGSQAEWSVVRFVVLWALLMTMVLLARPRGSSPTQRLWAGGLVLALIALRQASEFYRWGHWWHLPVVLVMAWAGGQAASSRWVRAGVLLGLAMWFEPFAAVGVAMLVLSPGLRVAIRAAVLAAVVAALAYLPFVLTGSFAMGRRVLGVSPGTWASVVFGAQTPTSISFTLRVLEAVVAVTLAVLVMWHLRSRLPLPVVAFLAATAAVLARIAVEPFWWPYYPVVPFILLACTAMRLAWLRRPETLPVGLGVLAMAILSPFAPPLGATVALLMIALAALRVWTSLWDRLAVDFAPMRRGQEPDFVAESGTR